MPRLTKDKRNQLVGILHRDALVATVARRFNVAIRTVYVITAREITIGSQNQNDRPHNL